MISQSGLVLINLQRWCCRGWGRNQALLTGLLVAQ